MRVKLVSCFCVAAACITGTVRADGPNALLKDIEAIDYLIAIGPDNEITKTMCRLDWDNLQTSFRFVANRSSRLKVIPWSEHGEKAKALREEANALYKESYAKEAEYQAAQQRADRYVYMPTLFLTGDIHTIPGGCAVTVDAELKADTYGTKLRVNDAFTGRATVKLWSTGYWLPATASEFSSRVSAICERILKELVNDWTASQ